MSDPVLLAIVAVAGGILKMWASHHFKRLNAHTQECNEDRERLHIAQLQTQTEQKATQDEQIKHIKRTSHLETVVGIASNCPHPACPNRAILKHTTRITTTPATTD